MATAHDVKLYEVCSGNVKATYLGIESSGKEAMIKCVARSSLTRLEKDALTNKIRWGMDSEKIDTQRWSFTVQHNKTVSP